MGVRSREILRELIAFPTVSVEPNRALIDYCADLLTACGARVEIIPDEAAGKANLFATLGPPDRPGVLLSGHTDVVPVEGQAWSKPPFELTEEAGKLFGRGTCDMKGFVAAALACAESVDPREQQPGLQRIAGTEARARFLCRISTASRRERPDVVQGQQQ